MSTRAPTTPKEPRKRSHWLRTSCLGCLGLLLLMVLIPAGMFLVAVIQGPAEEDRRTRNLVHRLPVSLRDADRTPVVVPPGSRELMPLPGLGVAAGEVVLDISMAEFHVVPGPAGEPIRVEADYDAGSFALEETYEPRGELGWSYKLSFRSTISSFRRLLGGHDMENSVRLILPRGVPMRLSGDLGIGETDVELGGLSLTEVDLRIGIGEHAISFSEPTAAPVSEVRLIGSIGETRVRGLGNASPRHLLLRHRIGEVYYDLRGDWQQDADIDVRCGIGECTVRIPRDGVNIAMGSPGWIIGERNFRDLRGREPIPGAPTLDLDVSARIGELTIRD